MVERAGNEDSDGRVGRERGQWMVEWAGNEDSDENMETKLWTWLDIFCYHSLSQSVCSSVFPDKYLDVEKE